MLNETKLYTSLKKHFEQFDFIKKINKNNISNGSYKKDLYNLISYEFAIFNPSDNFLHKLRNLRINKDSHIYGIDIRQEFENNPSFFIYSDCNGTRFCKTYTFFIKNIAINDIYDLGEDEIDYNKINNSSIDDDNTLFDSDNEVVDNSDEELTNDDGNRRNKKISEFFLNQIDSFKLTSIFKNRQYFNNIDTSLHFFASKNNLITKLLNFLPTDYILPIDNFALGSQYLDECCEFVNWLPIITDLYPGGSIAAINFNPDDPDYEKIGILYKADEDSKTIILKDLHINDIINTYSNGDKINYLKLLLDEKIKNKNN